MEGKTTKTKETKSKGKMWKQCDGCEGIFPMNSSLCSRCAEEERKQEDAKKVDMKEAKKADYAILNSRTKDDFAKMKADNNNPLSTELICSLCNKTINDDERAPRCMEPNNTIVCAEELKQKTGCRKSYHKTCTQSCLAHKCHVCSEKGVMTTKGIVCCPYCCAGLCPEHSSDHCVFCKKFE